MPGKWEWDDVRFFLAASREGSLSGAARTLSVDHVTVGRRIAALEKYEAEAKDKPTVEGALSGIDHTLDAPALDPTTAERDCLDLGWYHCQSDGARLPGMIHVEVHCPRFLSPARPVRRCRISV